MREQSIHKWIRTKQIYYNRCCWLKLIPSVCPTGPAMGLSNGEGHEQAGGVSAYGHGGC